MVLGVFSIFLMSVSLSAQAGFGTAEKLNDDWSFSLAQAGVTEVADSQCGCG